MFAPPLQYPAPQNMITVPLDTISYKYNRTYMNPEFFGEGYKSANDLIDKIERECKFFEIFRSLTKWHKYFPYLFFLVIPFTFGFGIAGGFTGSFVLTYVGVAIGFIFVIANIALRFYLNSKFDEEMQKCNEKSINLVNQHNNDSLLNYNLRAQYKHEIKYIHHYRRTERRIEMFLEFYRLGPNYIGQANIQGYYPSSLPLGTMQGYLGQQPGTTGSFMPSTGNLMQSGQTGNLMQPMPTGHLMQPGSTGNMMQPTGQPIYYNPQQGNPAMPYSVPMQGYPPANNQGEPAGFYADGRKI